MSGTVRFEQVSEQEPTVITYNIQGNDPSAERGIHIHQFGDNTNGCTSAGPHCTSFFLSFFLSSPPSFSFLIYNLEKLRGGSASTIHTEKEEEVIKKKNEAYKCMILPRQ